MLALDLILWLVPALAGPAVAQDTGPTPPPQPPAAQQPAPAPEAKTPVPNGGRRPVTRESLREQLRAIANAARRLEELAGDDAEQRSIAHRIAWAAEQMRSDLAVPEIDGAEEGEPAANGGPQAGTEPGPETVETTGLRADPERWKPVRAPKVVRTSWGTNVRQAAEAAGGKRAFSGEHHLAVSPGGAVMSTFYEPHRGYSFRNCIFEGAPGDNGRVATRWGFRAYDVIDWRFDHCEWRNIPDEHGCYLSAPGSVTWNQCRFEGIGSQAIQVVYRWEAPYAHETSDPSLRNLGGLQRVVECLVLECGKPTGGRPAYALSFFEGPRCDVRIERSYIQTLHSDHLDHQGLPSSSYGAIMVHDRPRVEILDTYINYRRPDRPVIQIWNVDEVVISGCEIVEGQIELRNCRKVKLSANKGSAHVTVGTGPAYVWPMPKVIYEGPMQRDWQQ